jgi:hypothetical protein
VVVIHPLQVVEPAVAEAAVVAERQIFFCLPPMEVVAILPHFLQVVLPALSRKSQDRLLPRTVIHSLRQQTLPASFFMLQI